MVTFQSFKTIKKIKNGAFGESNSGPLAPKARIIPLDQMPWYEKYSFVNMLLEEKRSLYLLFLQHVITKQVNVNISL